MARSFSLMFFDGGSTATRNASTKKPLQYSKNAEANFFSVIS